MDKIQMTEEEWLVWINDNIKMDLYTDGRTKFNKEETLYALKMHGHISPIKTKRIKHLEGDIFIDVYSDLCKKLSFKNWEPECMHINGDVAECGTHCIYYENWK